MVLACAHFLVFAVYWSHLASTSPETKYKGTLVCMDPADHLAFDVAGMKQSEAAFKVQYTDCTAEVLDLVDLCKVGCPCTSLCELQSDCSRAKPASYHRKRWVLAEHDTDKNKQLLLALDAEEPMVQQQDEQDRPDDESSSDDDVPLGQVHQSSRARQSSSDDDDTLAQAGLKQKHKRKRKRRKK